MIYCIEIDSGNLTGQHSDFPKCASCCWQYGISSDCLVFDLKVASKQHPAASAYWCILTRPRYIHVNRFIIVCLCLLPIWTCGTLWVSRCIHLWDDSPEAGHIQFVSPAVAAETQLIAYIRSNWMEPVFPLFFHVFLFLKFLKYFFTLLISSQSQCQSSKSLSFLFRSSGSLLTTISSAGSLLGSSSQPDQDVSVQGRLLQKFRILPRKIEELYAKMIKKYQTCAKANCLCSTSKPRLCRQWVLQLWWHVGCIVTMKHSFADVGCQNMSKWADPFGGPSPQKCRQASRTHSLFCSCLAQRINELKPFQGRHLLMPKLVRASTNASQHASKRKKWMLRDKGIWRA